MNLSHELKLNWCSHDAAKYAVEHWHYSKKMPVNKTAKIGVWENSKFIGAIVFSCGSAGTSSTGKRYGLSLTQVCELARVALKSHKSEVTRIVRISLSMLKKSQKKLMLVVSYADPQEGHIGKIYQAGNWLYVGRSSKDYAFIDSRNKKWHSRSVSETGYKIHCGVKSRCPKPSSLTKILLIPKYKYLMPLDDEIRKRIVPLSKPYPKRAGSVRGDTPADQVGEGGSSPTPALHNLTNPIP